MISSLGVFFRIAMAKHISHHLPWNACNFTFLKWSCLCPKKTLYLSLISIGIQSLVIVELQNFVHPLYKSCFEKSSAIKPCPFPMLIPKMFGMSNSRLGLVRINCNPRSFHRCDTVQTVFNSLIQSLFSPSSRWKQNKIITLTFLDHALNHDW